MKKDLFHSKILPFAMIFSLSVFLAGNFLKIKFIDNPFSTVIFGIIFFIIIFAQISYLKKQIKIIGNR